MTFAIIHYLTWGFLILAALELLFQLSYVIAGRFGKGALFNGLPVGNTALEFAVSAVTVACIGALLFYWPTDEKMFASVQELGEQGACLQTTDLVDTIDREYPSSEFIDSARNIEDTCYRNERSEKVAEIRDAIEHDRFTWARNAMRHMDVLYVDRLDDHETLSHGLEKEIDSEERQFLFERTFETAEETQNFTFARTYLSTICEGYNDVENNVEACAEADLELYNIEQKPHWDLFQANYARCNHDRAKRALRLVHDIHENTEYGLQAAKWLYEYPTTHRVNIGCARIDSDFNKDPIFYTAPDPYVVVKLDGSIVYRTQVYYDDYYPCWNESRPPIKIKQNAEVTVELWDRDEGPGRSDDHLATYYLRSGSLDTAFGRSKHVNRLTQVFEEVCTDPSLADGIAALN